MAGTTLEWDGVPVYPSGFHGYSQDVIVASWRHFDGQHPGPTILATLYDVWVIDNPAVEAEIPLVMSWVPIDTFPANPKIVSFCQRENVYPVAMSRHGQEMLAARDVESVYVPHSIDTGLFRPGQTVPDGRRFRELTGIGDDRFVVLMVSTNKGNQPVDRKAYPEQLMAFAEFAKTRDDAVLFIHADQHGMHNGIPLGNLIEDCGISPDQVWLTDQYHYRTGGFGDRAMAAMFADADVLLMTSRGEGFGIPVVEAQACGTPVIVTDATSQPELCGDGWLVSGQPIYHPGQRAWWMTPSVNGIVGALEAAYERGVGESSEKARRFAEQFDHDAVWDQHWTPALDGMEQALQARLLKQQVQAKSPQPKKKKKGKRR